MARLLLGETEIDVSGEAEEILTRIVNARDGLRDPGGSIVAPPGWVRLSQITGDPIYVQVSRIGYVRED